ncbi:2-amino-4-hydroxy-6-hydroxymethyldihydropteridine diphosphokinase [Candidatus Peregrinibacteria bacterium CG_4_9_14_0_2_um_filter_53_11]|nr:MAG: 2-amino-4-hydroxy-6-hydroxymethyldihydropteridine diphosphokinase [Candidatus Peregrinibacteria bacterium CG_4_9_14_0_2_um_filter_53_11]
MAEVILSLGSNQGDREASLAQALALLPLENLKLSRLYRSEPWGEVEGEGEFLNQVVSVSTRLSPEDLLEEIKLVEQKLGRTRPDAVPLQGLPAGPKKSGRHYLPRPIDIDILFYDTLIYSSSHLTIPHPLIAERRFVLLPLAELLPEYQHPVLKKTLRQLLNECEDASIVEPLYDDTGTSKTRDSV